MSKAVCMSSLKWFLSEGIQEFGKKRQSVCCFVPFIHKMTYGVTQPNQACSTCPQTVLKMSAVADVTDRSCPERFFFVPPFLSFVVCVCLCEGW